MDHVAQISRKMSVSEFTKVRDKMREKCGLPVVSDSKKSRALSDFLSPSGKTKQSAEPEKLQSAKFSSRTNFDSSENLRQDAVQYSSNSIHSSLSGPVKRSIQVPPPNFASAASAGLEREIADIIIVDGNNFTEENHQKDEFNVETKEEISRTESADASASRFWKNRASSEKYVKAPTISSFSNSSSSDKGRKRFECIPS